MRSQQTNYADYIRALRGLSNQIGTTVEVRWRDQNTGEVADRERLGSASAVVDLLSVVRLVPPGDADLRDRGAGVLEAAR